MLGIAEMNKLLTLWNDLVGSLHAYEDVLIAKQRAQEAKDNPQVMQPIAVLRQRLWADGLLDDGSKTENCAS